MSERRDRLVHSQTATIKAFTVIVEQGRMAGLAPLRWTVGSDLSTLSGEADMHVWRPDQTRSDQEATAAARLAAFTGWSALIEELTAHSIAEYGHHPAGERMATRFTAWEPRETELTVDYRAYAANVTVDVDRRRCVWLLSLGVRATVDKPSAMIRPAVRPETEEKAP